MMAAATEIVTDALGRKLTIRDLSALEEIRLLRAIGPQQSDNRPYVELVQAAASVAFIDSKPMIKPTNERQIDMLIEALGDEGIQVVQMRRIVKLNAMYAAAQTAMEAAQQDAASKEALGEVAVSDSPLAESAS